MNTKPVIRALVWGVVLTSLTMLVSYNFCLNGPARGFPFAAWCPECEATFAAVGWHALFGRIHVLDLARLLGDILLWSGVAFGAQATWSRRARQRHAW